MFPRNTGQAGLQATRMCPASPMPHVPQCCSRSIGVAPPSRNEEVRISGVQRLEGHRLKRASDAGVDAAAIQRSRGRLVEHLPMTERDWPLASWTSEV